MESVYKHEEIQTAFSAVRGSVTKFMLDSSPDSGLQAISSLKFQKNSEARIFELLMSHAIKAEAVAPGSAEILFKLLSGDAPIDSSVLPLSSHNIDQLLSTFSKGSIKNIVKSALEMAGLHGKIVLSAVPVNGENEVVELNSGSFFSDVQPAFSLKSSKFLNPKVLCIDGFIESVSEVHRILENASKSQETIIMFLRGLSDEVIHTLKVNYDRGTLSVVPVITKYDLDGVNLLNDIAVVSGGDVVSSLKGQLISAIDISSSPRVDVVDITSSGVLIENSKTAAAIDLHIFQLQQKLISQEHSASQELLAKRIQSLGTNRVSIKLLDDHNRSKKSFMIDRCLRAVKSASTYGICECMGKIYPYSSIRSANFYYQQLKELIENLGCIVA